MCQVKTKYYYMNNITKANVISQPQSKASVCVWMPNINYYTNQCYWLRNKLTLNYNYTPVTSKVNLQTYFNSYTKLKISINVTQHGFITTQKHALSCYYYYYYYYYYYDYFWCFRTNDLLSGHQHCNMGRTCIFDVLHIKEISFLYSRSSITGLNTFTAT